MRMLLPLAGILAAMCSAVLFVGTTRAETKDGDVLLYTYFRDNGQAGVCLCSSEDGVKFTPLNDDKPVFTPPNWPGQNLTRDASILFRDGVFRMVWTSHWKGRIFGYSESRDLVNWTEPRQVKPFPESLAKEDQPENVWAPEIHFDPLKQDYFVLFASTTPRERKDGDGSDNKGNNTSPYDNRIFITRSKDGQSWSDAKLFFDQGFTTIDAVMRPDEASKRWAMIVKNSRDWDLKKMPGRNLWLTFTGSDLDQPNFTPVVGPIAGNHSPMFSNADPKKSMAEGQSLLRWRDQWWLYWDEPAGDGIQLATSPDLEHWTHVKGASFPRGAKHGTAFLAPRESVGWLRGSAAKEDEVKPTCADDSLAGYKLSWSDEFEGTEVDTSKWSFRTGEAWWSTQQRQNVSVSGGVMRIALKKEKAGKMEYTAGGLISKPMFRYGYYEARLKCPPGAGWHTSFWAMGARGGKLELDFFENDSINPKRYGVNTHSYVPKNHSVGFKAVNTPDLAADFHVIGGEFTPTNLTYFFNGKPVATFASTNYPHDDMSIWLTSLAASLSGTKAVDETKLPAEALYDYVRFFTKEPEK